ncbi:hypothetical protein INT45_005199 [Circinella minor]|uniref:Uncharacterized protein n=1 Tax=Circinella minor TaxID=1195481 RepID=A0A8H7S3R3_9FUNG|nr:hypothetical protein INT45_005199 [Circinella minor]
MENNAFRNTEESTITTSSEHKSPLNKDIAEVTVQNLDDDDDNDDDDDGDHTYEQELVEKDNQKNST